MTLAKLPASPDVSSPSLTLAHPRPEEQIRTWTLNHAAWGASYTVAAYIARERALLDSCLPLTPWILTDGAVPDAERPVLASCETLRKRALVRASDGPVRPVFAHGIASVFTDPAYRRRGYARRMLALLAERLARWEAATPGAATFSVLFSDIGRSFYADLGWLPFESTHLAFPVPSGAEDPAADSVTPITDAELPALAQADELLVHAKLRDTPAPPPGAIRLALLPDAASLRWHLTRQGFMSRHIFDAEPEVHGALYTAAASAARRVWAVWTRQQQGGRTERESNVLLFLRFVVADETIGDEELAAATKGILKVARREARAWLCGSMQMWNPEERMKKLMLNEPDLDGRIVIREKDSIPSLRWFGPGAPEKLEWLVNEKFEWC